MANGNQKTILLIGTHGQYNWGDDILLDTFLSQLGTEHRYYINSYDPEGTHRTHGDKFDITRVFHTTEDLRDLPGIIMKSDLVVFAGGTIIRELYKSSNRNKYSSLLMVMGLVLFAKLLARKKVIMSNIGAGPVRTRIGKALARFTLSQVDLVSFRDPASFKLAADCGVRHGRMQVVPDSVFANPPQRFHPEHGSVTQRLSRAPLKIALNLNRDIANTDNWEHFTASLAQAFTDLAAGTPIELHGLPMQVAFNPHHDVLMLREFRSRLPTSLPFVEHTPAAPEDIGRIISSSDLVVAERLHALVIAAILGKPFLALTYDVKVASLVKTLQMEAYAVDINGPVDPAEVRRKILALAKDAGRIRSHLLAVTAKLHEETKQYFHSLQQHIADTR